MGPRQSWANRIVGHELVDPATLIANPANWRRHPDGQRAALVGSLDSVGWVAEATVNLKTGNLVDGHARVEEALRRGEPTIPVTYVELTEAEERLVLATLDPIGALATADADALEALLASLSTEDQGLRALIDELARSNGITGAAGLTDPDEIPPLPEPDAVTVARGERYRLGNHVLLIGDATAPEDVVRCLAGAEPTLLATDPPYGIALNLAWRDRAKGSQTRSRTAAHRTTELAGDERADWSEAFALVPSLGVGYVWHAAIKAPLVAAGLERVGFELVGQVIWDKERFVLGRSWYSWSHEPAWVVRKPGRKMRFIGSRDQTTIWRAPSPKAVGISGADTATDHPTQKPVLLFETPIRNHLGPGELLYDPFLGSGTALIAAEITGRRCYGLELDPRVAQQAIERWERFTGVRAVRED